MPPLLLALDGVQQLGVCWAVDPAPALLEEARASVHPSVHAVPRLHLLRAVRAKGKPVSCPWTPGLQFSLPGPCPIGFPFPQLPLPHPSPPPGCWLLVELSLLEKVGPPKTGRTCSPLIPVPRAVTDEPPWGPDHHLSPPYLLASTVCRTQPNIQSGIQCPTSQLPPPHPSFLTCWSPSRVHDHPKASGDTPGLLTSHQPLLCQSSTQMLQIVTQLFSQPLLPPSLFSPFFPPCSLSSSSPPSSLFSLPPPSLYLRNCLISGNLGFFSDSPSNQHNAPEVAMTTCLSE